MIRASVIISVYNRTDYLALLFAGFERQSFRDFEIILADDGSNENAVKEIETLSHACSFPVTHLWHEDQGFRKNKILNRAVTAARAEYLIIIDGDCVPHCKFVEEHFAHRQKNVCLTGRRVNLSEKQTAKLNFDNVRAGFLENNMPAFILDGLFGQSVDVEKGFYFTSAALRKFFNKKKRGIVGCNFSLFKSDLLAINGFDERYLAASVGEDSDVQFRLELNGLDIRSVNHMAVQYHLFHKLQARPQKNLDLFDQIIKSGLAFTPFGIEKTP